MPSRKKATSTKHKASLLDRIFLPGWLELLLILIFLVRLPSLFEPFYYGDEMIYLTLGNAIRQGVVLYQGIHDNKPPLLYFLASLAGNVFWFRAILAAWMMATTIAFWKLTSVLYPKKQRFQIIATVVFAILTTLPLLEGQIANAEVFMIGPTIVAFYLLLSRKLSTRLVFFAGILLSIATLFKVPAAFDLLAVVFLWVITLFSKNPKWGDFFRTVAVLTAGFLVPLGISFIWYWSRGALNDYFVAAFLQNVGYLSSQRVGSIIQQEPFLVRNGPILFRGIVMGTGLFTLLLLRNRLSKQFVFACAWLLVGLFAVTLSERPYPHYFIQVVPSIALLAGMLGTLETIEQSLTIIPLSLVLLVAVHFKFWYYPSLPYFTRFMQFATGTLSQEEYFTTFDKNVNRNYKLAKFLISTSKQKETVFIWGDSAPIYALSDKLPPMKYIATYHINDFSSNESVIKTLTTTSPEFIIILPGSDSFPQLTEFVRKSYMLIHTIDEADVWKLIPPRTTSLFL